MKQGSDIQTFEDLETYKAGREYRKRISQFCETLPKEEEYRLKDQILISVSYSTPIGSGISATRFRGTFKGRLSSTAEFSAKKSDEIRQEE